MSVQTFTTLGGTASDVKVAKIGVSRIAFKLVIIAVLNAVAYSMAL